MSHVPIPCALFVVTLYNRFDLPVPLPPPAPPMQYPEPGFPAYRRRCAKARKTTALPNSKGTKTAAGTSKREPPHSHAIADDGGESGLPASVVAGGASAPSTPLRRRRGGSPMASDATHDFATSLHTFADTPTAVAAAPQQPTTGGRPGTMLSSLQVWKGGGGGSAAAHCQLPPWDHALLSTGVWGG